MDLQSLLFGEEEWTFLLETFIRTFVMFLVILIALRLLGKRGIHQLSVFELGVIIGLGSAAGDPMFYKDVGILPSMIVFIVVVCMYRLVTYLISKSERFEKLIEGKPTSIIKEGIILESFKKQPLGRDELLASLRQKHIYHLGQLETVIIESDGQLSVFFYPDDKVLYGLPIIPALLDNPSGSVTNDGFFSCALCGFTEKTVPQTNYSCKRCHHKFCVQASNAVRIR
jgi:uncharacterized membrane protein YcaP (DUF421 family)